MSPTLERGPYLVIGRGVSQRIAESYGDVAQPALMADPADRRTGQAGVKIGRRPGK